MKRKPTNLMDLLELQRKLDGTIGAKRNNGFKPKERTEDKIMLSIIAECIEFNEELEETHKTWKQKEIYKEKQLEEVTDILFFIAQWINYREDKENCSVNWINSIVDSNDKSIPEINLNILFFIDSVMSRDLEEVVSDYCRVVNIAGFTLEQVFTEYQRKWNINMNRINKDWSITSQN